MDQQIMHYNRMMQNEQVKKAERYHNGLKYGEYYTLLKRAQSYLQHLYQALTSQTNIEKGERYSNCGELTTETN